MDAGGRDGHDTKFSFVLLIHGSAFCSLPFPSPLCGPEKVTEQRGGGALGTTFGLPLFFFSLTIGNRLLTQRASKGSKGQNFA